MHSYHKSKDYFGFIILLGILIVPFLSSFEVYALMTNNLSTLGKTLTPLWIKILKDIILVAISLLGFLYQLKHKVVINNFYVALFALFLTVILISLFLSIHNPVLVTLSGLRWALPLLIPFFIFPLVDDKLIHSIKNPILFLLFLNFSFQIFQKFLKYDYYRHNIFGFSDRSPGLFLMPNTSAAFTVLALLFCLFFIDLSKPQKVFLKTISFLSVLFSGSFFGILSLIAMIAIDFRSKFFYKFLLILSISFFSIIYFIYVSDRGYESMVYSINTRFTIFISNLQDAGFFSNKFGLGTNTAYLISSGSPTDSNFSCVLVNLGIVGFVIFIGMIFFNLLLAFLRDNKRVFTLNCFILLASFSLSYTETYPVNLITILIVSFLMNLSNTSAVKASKLI